MSLIDKIEDVWTSLTELTTKLKVASQARRNTASDHTENTSNPPPMVSPRHS